MHKKIYSLLFGLLCIGNVAKSQPEIIDRQKYPFINFDKNEIFIPDGLNFNPFLASLADLLQSGNEQINIVHIGDSHIQADFFSGKMRELFQSIFPGGNGGRGFIFPYTMAKTNNPTNYKVKFTGNWLGCRNVQYTKSCMLGLAGISVTTSDNYSTFTITTIKKELFYDYTRLGVFHDPADTSYNILLLLNDSTSIPGKHIGNEGKFEWVLNEPVNSATFAVQKKYETAAEFTLMGVALETNDPGIVYHSLGVNGAEVRSFLRCQLFASQLKALQPNLVVLSLGTNDAYTAEFNALEFKENYRQLVRKIKFEMPNALILLTTPGDCYRNKKFANPHNKTARDVIFALAKEEQLAVWDFFEAMGGFGSVQQWYKNGLAAGDRVHLSSAGYYLQAELLFEAFMKAYDNYIDKKKH